MANVVNLTPETLRRIIAEEKQKLIAEAKQKADKTVGPKLPAPKEPSVKGGKKSKVPAQTESQNAKSRKAMQLDEREVDADDLAGTLAKEVKHLKEMREIEGRLRTQLRLVVESRTALEKKLANIL